jgi:hypothetical protein
MPGRALKLEYSPCGFYLFMITSTGQASSFRLSISNAVSPLQILAEAIIHSSDSKKLQVKNVFL